MTAPRILFVGNFLTRHWGAGRTGIDMRLMAGAIRNDWPVMTFSERDIARFLAPLGVLRGIGARMMNARLVKTVRNWRPDIVFISHCDYVTNESLDACRAAVPGVKLVHINCDPISTEHCREQIARRVPSCDAIFLTTAGTDLKTWLNGRNQVGFFPNPSDPSYDGFDNSRRDAFRYDLFFAGRPVMADERRNLIDRLQARLDPSVRFGLFGMGKGPLIIGRDYEQAIADSKMGLSLNRFRGKWYASDRITHLMANGVLTFLYDGDDQQRFFSDRECVYFHTPEELAERIAELNGNDAERRRIAAAGREKYQRLFAARRVLKYMVETVLGMTYTEAYEWSPEVYR